MPAPPTRRTRTALVAAGLLALCAAGIALRLQVVVEYRNFAGDGWQYYHLAQNLVGPEHRYALGPPPQPPAWSRLPGYPIFVAAAGIGAPRFNELDVALRVARSQVFLDAGTAVAAFLLASELGLALPAWLAALLCLGSPLLALATTYILSETLAVFLTTVALWLVLRACRLRAALHLSIAGAVCGAALLVRADSVTLLPLLAMPLLRSREPLRQRLRATLLAAACALAVFAPWPLRNLVLFHHPHALGASWVTKGGDPLPSGVQRWLLTWAVDPHDATADIAWKMTRATPIYGFQVPAAATDSPAEKKRVTELFEAYNKAGWITPAVDEGFHALAAERRARDRFRYYVRLPLQRAREMWWNPVPDWELPAVSATLGLPDGRAQLAPLTHRTLVLAALGLLLVLVLRPGPGRSLALLVLVAAAARTVAIVFVVAGGTQRYVLELWPALLALAAFAVAAPVELLIRRWLVAAGSSASPSSAATRAPPPHRPR